MTSHVSIAVSEASQPVEVRMAVRRAAASLGFSEEDAQRAAIVGTELATNLVKHTTGSGEILVRARTSECEIEILSLDRGPGMADVGVSMSDGHSTSGSPGTGLGAVRRLADVFDLYSSPGQGTVVMARVRSGRARLARAPLEAAGVSVPRAGESVCGDGWMVRPHDRGPITAIADGLGHGPEAGVAAHAALHTLTTSSFATLVEALALIHDALRPTRGAALSLLQIDRHAGVVRFAGLGNVGAAVCQNGSTRQAVSLNGTLGHEARTFREFTYPWTPGAFFVMFSDGLISHWSLAAYPGLTTHDPAVIAAVLYRDFSRGRDDVTVVVGREAA